LGQEKNIGDIDFYVVPDVEEFQCGHDPPHMVNGFHQGGRIVLAEAGVLNSRLVSHEMIHAYGHRESDTKAFDCEVEQQPYSRVWRGQ
jgi:hypothetical protein